MFTKKTEEKDCKTVLCWPAARSPPLLLCSACSLTTPSRRSFTVRRSSHARSGIMALTLSSRPFVGFRLPRPPSLSTTVLRHRSPSPPRICSRQAGCTIFYLPLTYCSLRATAGLCLTKQRNDAHMHVPLARSGDILVGDLCFAPFRFSNATLMLRFSCHYSLALCSICLSLSLVSCVSYISSVS